MRVEHTAESRAMLQVTEVAGAPASDLRLIWGHGWGQSGAALAPLAETLKPFAGSWVIDFPGFGRAPNPPETWGTAEYADLTAEWIKAQGAARFIWVGHSFGGRVGIQLAARYPELLSGMVLIASAGLRRQRTFLHKVNFAVKRAAFKAARRFVRDGPGLERLRQRFGSADYRSAGALRPILTRVVAEDLTEQAKQVRCRTLLIYGTRDTETPPEMGKRLHALIPGSELALLEGFDHLSVLTAGRHQVAVRMRRFLEVIE